MAAVLAAGTVPQAAQDTGILTRAAALESPDSERVLAASAALRAADQKLKGVAGSDAERSRHLATLLESALTFHATHGDGDCPVCRSAAALSKGWAESSRREVTRLRGVAAGSDQAHKAAEAALRSARELLSPPPKLLAQLFDIGLEGLAGLRESWTTWHAGATITDLTAMANHLETHHEEFTRAIEVVRKAAAAELQRREDRWRPIATSLSEWIAMARDARAGKEDMTRIKEAENWLKEASADIRNERFAPIADQAMATWQHSVSRATLNLDALN